MEEKLKLLPCPFCGGPADFESVEAGHSVAIGSGTWSVGCQNVQEDCIGYMLMAKFARKVEAAEAWNKRPAPTISNIPGEWTCGHIAGSVCAECHRILAAKAHELAEENIRLKEEE